MDSIRIRGARTHNLRNLDVTIPRGKMTVITGVSGSGKSSLAFDTLYAEGLRKYLDSLSTRARQAFEQLPRPDVDYIEGLSPVLAVEQRDHETTNPRSTVATLTEVADYARVLWAAKGVPHCPLDGGRVERRSLDDNLSTLLAEPEGTRAVLLAPWLRAKVSVLREELPRLRQRGFQRVRLDGDVCDLDDIALLKDRKGEVTADLVIDRVVLRDDQRSRLADSLELAFREGKNQAMVLLQSEEEREADTWREMPLSQHFACTICGKVYEEPTPRLFSYNTAEGACPTCGGLGETFQFVEELVVPDPEKSVYHGAIKPWRIGSKGMIVERNAILKQLSEQVPFDRKKPWQELPEEVRQLILHGDPDRLFAFKLKRGNAAPEEKPFAGVIADLENAQRTSTSEGFRARLTAFQVRQTCPTCKGSRMSPYASGVLLAETSFPTFMAMSVAEASAFADRLRALFGDGHDALAEAARSLAGRLHYLANVGLGYLTLERSSATLSGGEAQRVRLATQVGMGLTGVIYVLDEPSIGLHPRDNEHLLRVLDGLRDPANALVVVEHDEDAIRRADHLIEMGPGAGHQGGAVMFEGTPNEAEGSERCLTGQFLSGERQLEKSVETRQPRGRWLNVLGATAHNLKNVDASFPIGLLTVVCGVSGSGKSTLVNDILAKAAAMKLNGAKDLPGAHRGLQGLEAFRSVVRVDQSPIGRSPRSNPATFTKIFDLLRQLFAQTPLAKVRGYTASRFSFNTPGGRCERCGGDGMIRLDMQFLPDAYTVCPSCHGKRYNRETLDIRFRGYTIADVLEMTVEEAAHLFRHQPKILAKLETLRAVGLGYLKLGQPATTLSGGEAQRLKLSLELSRKQSGDLLYLLDEPTTGLHWEDIQKLVDLLFQLRDAGNTIILIEHHLDVIGLADYLIELGPEGGSAGGQITYAGDPNGITKVADSPTGQCLARQKESPVFASPA